MNKAENIKIKKINKTDYRTIFYFGFMINCCGMVLTISTRNPGLLSIMAFGIILMINGLMNKDKWQ